MTDILRDIGMIARALDSIANIEFKELDLTKGQYLYLVRIYENEGIIPERLAELIKVDKSTTSRAIKKLEMNQFIEKKSDVSNKKNKPLFTTDKGKEAATFILRENDYSNRQGLTNLSNVEIDVLKELLNRVKENIDQDWQHVKNGQHRIY